MDDPEDLVSTATATSILQSPHGRGIATGIGTLLLGAAVGFGSGRSLVEVGGPRRLVDAGAYATDALVVFLAVALVGAVLIGYVLRPTRRRGEDKPRRVRERAPIPWRAALATVVVLLALIAALTLAIAQLPHGRSQPPLVRPAAPAPITGHRTRATTAVARAQLPPVHWWALIGVAGAVVAGVAGAGVVAVRRRRALAGTGDAPTVAGLGADELQRAVVASLEEIEREPDPRRAVIRAYARMEVAVATAGVSRRRADTPLEYLERTLQLLSVSPDTVGRLTRLFERARFSSREVDRGMRDDAVAALRGVRDELEDRT